MDSPCLIPAMAKRPDAASYGDGSTRSASSAAATQEVP